MKKLLALSIPFVLFMAACGGSATPLGSGITNNNGGGGGTTTPATGANTVTITVSAGADPNSLYTNGAFASATICAPGTSTCSTIPNLLVDTGSVGIRLLSSVVSLGLTNETISGSTLMECNQFVDSYTWGPVATADVKLNGEVASSLPIQIIDDRNQFTVPTACSGTGTSGNSVSALGANGILGVGSWRQDCGGFCATQTGAKTYFVCPSTGCVETLTPLSQQVLNPVWKFPTDNNGVIVQLPAVSSPGATTLSGTLIFGIGTQTNNALGSAAVFTLDNLGNFTTKYNGQSYSSSFIDSGSNGLFFLDAATTGMPVCTDVKDFYCPPSSKSFTATNVGANATTNNVTFAIDNADALFSHQTLLAYPTLGGPNSGAFDWGLPFFYGRTVYTALEGQNAAGTIGPYWAY